MQTLGAILEKFKAYGLELEKIEQSQQASQQASQKPSQQASQQASLTTKRRPPNIARIKAKETKLRESLEASLKASLESNSESLEASLDVKSLEASLDVKSLGTSLDVKSLGTDLDSKTLEWFYAFARSELERLEKLLTAWRESGKPQRATERILRQMAKFSNFCRKYEAISTAPIFGVNNQKSNILPVVYKSHALKRATKPENIGLMGLNPETAQTIGANLATGQTDKGIFYQQKGNERKYKRIARDIATNGLEATIKPSKKESRKKVFSYALTAGNCFLVESEPLRNALAQKKPEAKKQLKLQCVTGLKLQGTGRIKGFIRQLESALLGAPKRGLIATWLTIDKPNNPSVKHDRNFEALKDAAKIFTNGYGLAFCQISRIGGIQGTYRATFAKADKGQALAPTYEASETLAGSGNLRVYTLKLKQANEGKK